jgi:hypothetical protein
MDKRTKEKFPKQQGMFSPTEPIVITLASDHDAQKVKQAPPDGDFNSTKHVWLTIEDRS